MEALGRLLLIAGKGDGGGDMRFSEEANMQLNHISLRLHMSTERNDPHPN